MDTNDTTLVAETCEVCGSGFVRPVGRRRRRCYGCKSQAVLDSVDQLREKSGPVYEKMARKNFEHWRDELKRLKLTA